MAEPLLESSGLTFKYPGEEKAAVDDVSFKLSPKEIVTIVGSSGSGKTTLLNLIAGNLSPSSGRVLINGEIMQDPANFLVKGFEDVEIVKQDFQLSPRHTVYQTIKHPLRRYNQEYQEERAHELIALCNLSGLEERITMDLSGGQKQRVAIARSLADNPDLILMDEPFNQLDHTIKLTLKSELRSIMQDTNTGTLIVTHDPLDALSVSDRIIVMRNGAAVSIATPKDHYLRPFNSYTALLFGQYNIFSKQQLKSWSISIDSDYAGCRPEHVKVEDDGRPFQVVDANFLGMHFLISAVSAEGLNINFYSKEVYAIGEKVNLLPNHDCLHPILL